MTRMCVNKTSNFNKGKMLNAHYSDYCTKQNACVGIAAVANNGGIVRAC